MHARSLRFRLILISLLLCFGVAGNIECNAKSGSHGSGRGQGGGKGCSHGSPSPTPSAPSAKASAQPSAVSNAAGDPCETIHEPITGLPGVTHFKCK